MSEMKQEQLMGWVKDGKPTKPSERFAYGGVADHGRVWIKTPSGECFSMSLSSDKK